MEMCRFSVLPVLLCFSLVASSSLAQDAPKVAGQDVPPPKRTRTVLPDYPPEAQAQGLHGIVILELIIDAQGRVAEVKVIRSVPPFDEPATLAVKKWEYEITKLDGKPVSVLLTVPITFALRLPEVSRQEGIPELRQGASPPYPNAKGGGKVTAEITIDPDGRIADALVTAGEGVWADAVLQALKTWRFAPSDEPMVSSFRLEAEFQPARDDRPQKVALRLSGLHKTAIAEPVPHPESAPAATAATPAPAAPPAATEAPPASTTTPAPLTPATVAPAIVPPLTSAPAAAAPSPTPVSPDKAATPSNKAGTPSAAPARASNARAAQPPTEVLTAPPPPPPLTPPPPPPMPGVSAVDGVSLSIGVPDLVMGRRPSPPPFARLAGEYGAVDVKFAVNAAGNASVLTLDGPPLLKPAAEVTVGSWSFRRTTAERLYLTATVTYRAEGAQASVAPTPPEAVPAAPVTMTTPAPSTPAPVAPPPPATTPAPTPAPSPIP